MQLIIKRGYFGAANKFQKSKHTHKHSSKQSNISIKQALKQSQSKENAFGEF
jgi:hypothetical protein